MKKNKIQLKEHFGYRKLMRFTLPTITMMIFTSIYGIVDGFFVSNCVGKEPFSALNLIWPVVMILGSIGFMIGTGGSAYVSVKLGEQKKEDANRYFSMFLYLEVIVGVILSIVGYIFARPIAGLLGAQGAVLDYCVVYGRVLFVGLVFFLLQNSFQSFLVVAEMPKFGLVVSVMAGVTNMILDFLLVYVWKLGLFGAALATVISQVVGAAIPVVFFIRNKKGLHLVPTGFEWRPIKQTCINGSSEMVSNLSMSLISVLYNLQLMKYAGINGVNAYGVVMYISMIFAGVYMGYSIGVSPVIGYHYGAENKEELKGLLRKSLKMIFVAAIVMTVAAECLSGLFAEIFVGYDKELLEMTVRANRLFSLAYLICGFNMFASAFFTALGNGLISAVISFARTFLFQIIMIYLLPVFLGLNGLWIAMVVAEVLTSIVSIYFLVTKRRQYQY